MTLENPRPLIALPLQRSELAMVSPTQGCANPQHFAVELLRY
jgi:hypothetical protein